MPGFPAFTTIGGAATNGHPATYFGEIETLEIPEGVSDHSICSVLLLMTTRHGFTVTVAPPSVSQENLMMTFLRTGAPCGARQAAAIATTPAHNSSVRLRTCDSGVGGSQQWRQPEYFARINCLLRPSHALPLAPVGSVIVPLRFSRSPFPLYAARVCQSTCSRSPRCCRRVYVSLPRPSSRERCLSRLKPGHA